MWIKSSRCDSNACLRMWPGSLTVWVQDSTRPGEVLSVSRLAFRAFVASVRRGEVHR